MQTRVRSVEYFRQYVEYYKQSQVDLDKFSKGLDQNLQNQQRQKSATAEDIIKQVKAKEEFVRDVRDLCSSAADIIQVSLRLIEYGKNPQKSEYFSEKSQDYIRGYMQGIAILEINLNANEQHMKEMITHIGNFRDYVVSTIAPY